MPAILQDNHRALVVGTKTAGAGGFLLKTEFPNRFGIDILQLTASLAKRDDQIPIENNGVSPDLCIPFSAADLQFGYKEYITKINGILDDMVFNGYPNAFHHGEL